MWTVQFRDYLEFSNVKQDIKKIKAMKKEHIKRTPPSIMNGVQLEEGISKIISDIPGFEVKPTTPQIDIGFGADLLVSFKEGDKNYSFFADISTNDKPNVKYYTASGLLVEDKKSAFCYETEYFKIRFGLKEKHMNWFFYEKPVVVMHIENYIPTSGLAHSHINNIGNLLRSLHGLLVQMEYGARASQKVRPNPKRFPSEYRASK